MTSTVEIAKETQAWLANFEMQQQMRPHGGLAWSGLAKEALQHFAELGFPSTKHEEWKYTSLRPISTHQWNLANAAKLNNEAAHLLVRQVVPEGLDAYVFIRSGNALINMSGDLEPGLSIVPLSQSELQERFGKVASMEGRALVALNLAMFSEGICLKVERKTQVSKPVFLIHHLAGDDSCLQGRNWIEIGAFSELKMVEAWVDESGKMSWHNHVSEVLVGENAKLEQHFVQNQVSEGFQLTQFVQVEQGQASHYKAATMSASGKMIRNDLQVLHKGQQCETHLDGLSLLQGESHVDHHTLVDHALPHCESNETYKTVLDGKSTCIFNGKVMVRPDAQKTNAFQSNKTLLLSQGATVNAKPQLEIYADDVKCSHGATTGQIDETALFYLRSRGLAEKRAKALLTYAFGAEVLEAISIPELRESLEAFLFNRLSSK